MIGRIAASTFWQMASLAVSLGDRVLLGGLLLRAWGVATFEDWSVLLAAGSMFAMIDVGLHQTFSNSITAARQGGDAALYERRAAVARFMSAVMMIAGLAVLSVLLTAHGSAPVAVRAVSPRDAALLFLGFSVTTLAQNASFLPTAVYRANGLFSRDLAINVSALALRTLAVGSVAATGSGPLAACAVYAVSTILYLVVLLPWDQVRRLALVRYRLAVPTLRDLVEIASQSWMFALQQLGTVLLQYVPLLLLARVENQSGQIAAFVLLRTLVNSARQVILALSNSIGVELSQVQAARGEGVPLRSDMTRSTRMLTLLNAVILGALLAIADPVFRLWSGGRFGADPAMTVVFVLGYLASGPFTAVSTILTYVGRARIGAISRCANVAAATLVGLALVPFQGVLGVVIGLAAGEAIGAGPVYLPGLARIVGIGAVTLAGRLLAVSAAGVALPLLVHMLVKPPVEASPFLRLLVEGASLAAVVPVAVVLLGLSRKDRVTLWLTTRSVLRRVRRG